MPQSWRVILFFVIVPILTGCVNLFPIYVSDLGHCTSVMQDSRHSEQIYGWLETIGGAFKALMLVAICLLLYVLAGQRECALYVDLHQH